MTRLSWPDGIMDEDPPPARAPLALVVDQHPETLEAFIGERFSGLYAAAHAYAGTLFPVTEVEDVVQDAFLTLWKGLQPPSATPDADSLRARLFRHLKDRKARRARDDARRSRKLYLITPGPAIRRWMSITQPQEANELHQNIDGVLDRMRPTWREAWVLRYRHDLKLDEVATILGKAAVTVRVDVTRANELIRRALTDAGFAPETSERRKR